MSAPSSRAVELHPLVVAAGDRGELPKWAKVDKLRKRHMARVAWLMDEWAAARGHDGRERTRWRAAGWLHDALKGGKPKKLHRWVSGEPWPNALVHGPACAARLRDEGVRDEPLLDAITYHSTGHPELGELGVHLYLADFLEPGRRRMRKRRRRLRDRMPGDVSAVLRAVARLRMEGLRDGSLPIRQTTVEFWDRLQIEDR